MGEVFESGCIYKKIKIWETESCTLHSSSETKDFLNGILEWMPSGAKIATVRNSESDDGCPSIAFFERNGLERNSFRIGEPGDTLQTLKWNYASDLLAGVVSCKTHCAIRVWFFSNNHWYLKHEIRYPKEAGVMVTWDQKKPMQLICWTLGGQVTVCDFMWVTAVMDNSTAFVVDNSKILVTPLTFSLMPPPMYLFSLRFSSVVRDIAYYSRNSKKCLAVFLSDGNLSFVDFPALNTWEDLEGQDISVEISDCKTALGSVVHLLWLDIHSLLCVTAYGSSQNKCLSSGSYETELHGSYLQEIEVVSSEDLVLDQVPYSGFKASVAFQTPLKSQVIALAWNPSKRASAFVEFEDGKVLDYVSRSGIMEARINEGSVCFPSTFPLVRVAQVGADGGCKPLICGLDDMGRLCINGKSLCNNCSSFSFYSELANEVVTHLIILTNQDFLFIIDTKDVLQGEVALGTMYFVIDGRKRDEENISYVNIWERGAKVIGVLNGDEAAVILQTMRGNLECIYPRKLVLSSITNALAQQRFKDALNLVRRHRIDFNVIVDLYGWQAFLQSAVEFVEQVNNLNHITEFVCAMKNEDITETLYKKFFISKKENIVKDGCCGNKVTSVLQAIRKALEEKIPETPSRGLCILTTLARSDPPAIEESLLRIKSVREMELLNSCDNSRKKSSPSAEEALKHLVWLLDSEAVFDAALGLYDLNLAAIVALNSQRDPKEFLPYLQELERMSVPLMHYNIDIKLQRFDSALVNIVSAGDDYFPDCINLMKKNPQLFPLGLQLITDPEKKQVVLEAWGDHLTGEKRFEDAATTYLCCYRLEKASKAYRECGDWSGVLRVGALMKLGKDEILKLASELCEEVSALGKPGEAAKIALEYCKDISGGIHLLINAREWEEALRVAYLQHTSDDFISMVKNSSLECASGLVNEFKESIEKVGKYLTRYLAVRQRRLLLAAKLKSEERSVIDLDDDTASETSSNLSGMSAYTFGTRRGSAASVSSSTATSTKARDLRRQRKSGKIRAGSVGEETALVEHLKGMHMTEGGKRELKSLLICLVTLGEKESAQKLQQTAENFQVAQIAAVELADDTVSSETIDEQFYSLERYVKKTRSTSPDYSDAFSWMLKVFFICP